MKILGLKLTHDGAIALIDNGSLIFSYEMEKLNNNLRQSPFIIGLNELEGILNQYGYSLNTIDEIVVDGWGYMDVSSIENEITTLNGVEIDKGITIDINLAKYGRVISPTDNIMVPSHFTLDMLNLSYSSYMHLTGHIFSAYCTSPFAKRNEDSYILAWDGGMAPQLFYYKVKENKIINHGCLFALVGDLYTGFAYEYSPFDTIQKGDYSVPGKLMAYIALGNVQEALLRQFFDIYNSLLKKNINDLNPAEIESITKAFTKLSKKHTDTTDITNEDVLCTFHVFLEQLLIEKLNVKINESSYHSDNLCFVGGSALSIKWNSKIRSSGIFKNVWVPPFPNDSGSAIGTACAAMVDKTNVKVLDWSVYSGPPVVEYEEINQLYEAVPFTIKQLAALLHEKGEPVVFLNGRAELGPRALGNRSILAPSDNHSMKKLLNKIKGREDYRPVAPICIESDASNVFNPGSPDPYMLFEHMVKTEWKDKVPAIVHLDGSSRLQTVNSEENGDVYDLLIHYKRLTGIPLLSNTSANFNGKGFFPDVKSAMEWGKLNYIWSNNILYAKIVSSDLFKDLN